MSEPASAPSIAATPAPSRGPWARRLASWSRRMPRRLPRLLMGPIFQREVRSAGRRRWPYLARSLFAALLALVVFAFLMSTLSAREYQSRAATLQSIQRIAPSLLIAIAWVQFVLLTLAGPTLAGGAICDEKRARTLWVLMSTPISAGQIVGSKLTSRLVQMLILALVPLPLLLGVRVFGGVPADAVLRCVCLSLTTGVLGASIALTLSIYHKRAASATLSAIFCMALITAGPVTVEAIRAMYADAPNPWWPIFATCSPFVLGMISAEVAGDAGMPFRTSHMFLVNQAYVLGWIVVVLLIAAARLRRVLALEAAGGALVAAPAEADAAAPASKPARSREVGDDPVLWRELRQKAFASRRQFVILVIVVVIALLWMYVRAGPREAGVHSAVFVIATLAMLFGSLFGTTGGVANERESRTWSVLLSAPLSGRRILMGKFLGALRRQWFAPAVVAIDVGVGILAGGVHPLAVVIIPLLLLSPVVFLTGTGLLLSLRFQRAVTASVVNLIIAAGLWVGSFFVIGILSLLIDDFEITEPLFKAAFFINPVAMMATASEGLTDWWSFSRSNAGTDFDIADTTVGAAGFVLFTLVYSGIYVGLGLGALALASKRFGAWSGRSS